MRICNLIITGCSGNVCKLWSSLKICARNVYVIHRRDRDRRYGLQMTRESSSVTCSGSIQTSRGRATFEVVVDGNLENLADESEKRSWQRRELY